MAGSDMMQAVGQALKNWMPRVARATYSELEVTVTRDAITILAKWPETKVGPSGSHEIQLTRLYVLGATATQPPLHQRPTKKTCRYRDEIIRELLEVRLRGKQ